MTEPVCIGFLGPEGSHSHMAGLKLEAYLAADKPAVLQPYGGLKLLPYGSLAQVLAATEAREVNFGLLPIENALEGSVIEVLETLGLQKRQLEPCVELLVPVIHCLIQQTPGPVETVVSHPQALAQCRDTLYQMFGEGVRLESAPSTSEAVRSIQAPTEANRHRAAIGTMAAAERYGLLVTREDVSDAPDNLTRFLLLRSSTPQDGEDDPFTFERMSSHPLKTSLCIGISDRAGALVDILLLFKTYGVNLTKIESRPSKKRFGDYVFHMDAEGDLTASASSGLLEALQAETTYFRLLGPYRCLGRL